MAKQTLVVIGNGMAGARAVEEVLARGGAELYDIVMFGDEPYGNYNRIMLSNVLCGLQDVDDITINPLDWYADNAITLHHGNRVTAIDRAARVVTAADGLQVRYDVLRAGRCLDSPQLHLEPVPLLEGEDGLVKVALAATA